MKALILTTAQDFDWMKTLYPRLLGNLPVDDICFVGSLEVEEALNNMTEHLMDDVKMKFSYINESDIIPKALVQNCILKRLEKCSNHMNTPKRIVGWHYQQFLKMQFSRICKDEYYMVWDGDTVPTKPFSMFCENGTPYFDMKYEENPLYFKTLSRIMPGMAKVIRRSFISEHMLIKRDYMCELLDCIENNDNLEGESFWEKIISALDPEYMGAADFSEFETYGTFVCLRHAGSYQLRNWNSLRWAGDYFEPETIDDDDILWLSHDLNALSFEKGIRPTEQAKGILANKKYQKQLSARQIIEIIQEDLPEFFIKERWD